MTRLKKIVLAGFLIIILSISLWITLIGPWPVYRDSRFREKPYYKEALQAIDLAAAHADVTRD
ncbi:MAG TPA: hypothetical protein PLX03_13565, partial [Candidatus Hydrogenedentes bacterium]|nr:hypothetical protein [Candidatus Hydrogenedentota bacterium]